MPRILKLAYISVCAALYAAIGYLTYLGIFAPVVGVVRFWPSVVIPAVFSIMMGPEIGAAGAAIGIFISDMAIHGNALLSLTVGVPANYAGFYTMGVLARWKGRLSLLTISSLMPSAVIVMLGYAGLLRGEAFKILLIATLISAGISIVASIARKEFTPMLLACSIGLIIGSLIIGIGVWLFSQFFTLPSGESMLPVWAGAVWFVWTFSSEIPFLVIFVPFLVKILEKALPSRRRVQG